MANSNEQIMKAIAALIPEDAQKEVSAAISSFIEGTVAEMDKEYNEKLSEAFKTIEEEKKADESKVELGYNQAWDVITDLRDRLEVQKEEFEQSLEEGYEEAYQMLQEERAKNDNLEVSLYEEYDKRFSDIKEHMIDKIDQFLSLQGEKYYEMAKRDLMNDPALAEQKLAFDKVLEVAQNYLSDEDFAYATSSRVDGLSKQLDEQKAQIKILEAKNMRLATDNQRLTEAVKHTHNILAESKNNERTARTEKAQKAEGRGQMKTDRQIVIGEQQDSGESVTEQHSDGQRFAEQISEDVFADWKTLAGIKAEASK